MFLSGVILFDRINVIGVTLGYLKGKLVKVQHGPATVRDSSS